MWLIVTGPDKAGKSTLCKALSDDLGLPIRKCTHDIEHGALGSIIQEHTMLANKEENVLWDRWHYPEDIIYGAIVEHRPSVLSFYAPQVEYRMTEEIGAVYVHVTAEKITLVERYEASGDDYLSVEELMEVKDWYDYFMKNTTVPVVTINSSWCTPEEMVELVLSDLRRLKICK